MKFMLLSLFLALSSTLLAQFSGPIPPIDSGYGSDSLSVTSINIANDYFEDKAISVFYPEGTSSAIPTIFYAHGYAGSDTTLHLGLLRHMASRGYAVVFVPVRASIPIQEMYQSLIDGFIKAAANHTDIIDTTRVGFYGHSFGGGATPAVSYFFFTERNWGANGKFIYCSAPWYSYDLEEYELENFPADCNMLTVVYNDDLTNDHRMGIDIFKHIAIPPDRKDFITVYSDTIDGYIYEADHNLPTQFLFKNEFDALDYYIPFRLVDALADYTFTGNLKAKEIALGNGSAAQKAMGGILKPLQVTDTPSPTYPQSKYRYPCDTLINPRIGFCENSSPDESEYDSIFFDGQYRTYKIHLPEGYTGNTELPLIFAFHGGSGNARSMEILSQLSKKSDVENFIVVYPEGLRDGPLDISSWNAGWCCGYASVVQIDDVGYIDSLLNLLIDTYSVDANRVYATGMSNGGFFSYRLACELSDRFAAIATVECSMTYSQCSPTRAVPILHFHSYQDDVIPYFGGIGNGPSKHYNPSIDSVLNAWAAFNECEVLNDTLLSTSQYDYIQWRDCNCNTEIHSYITQDGGHLWPGNGGSKYVDATELIWSFFQQFSLHCDTASLSNSFVQNTNLLVYPNPARDQVILKNVSERENLKVSFYSLMGRLVLMADGQNVIDISPLEPGIYFMRVEYYESVYAYKLMVE